MTGSVVVVVLGTVVVVRFVVVVVVELVRPATAGTVEVVVVVVATVVVVVDVVVSGNAGTAPGETVVWAVVGPPKVMLAGLGDELVPNSLKPTPTPTNTTRMTASAARIPRAENRLRGPWPAKIGAKAAS
jgi:hypothetical protein